MILEILKELFDDSKIESVKDQQDYIILADYFKEEKTFKRKHLKKLKKKLKKQIEELTP